ncbi:MAG: SDR family NAD(P)-dependent oxidoreductase [Candidatus Cryptobacteroides sp.]|nr:SDR family NAD(P)-dependent oxidoreductase [Alistipes sp.]MDY4726563.1 SDR family NAD(P)-dependent oxidoreductase [Candidatus Cryptobacteroides sp.]MDY5199839.1 SDR family NAD(P)-dependent oxidoreductase [Candidatus Cryptobacteroides sp.]
MRQIEDLIAISRKFGQDSRFVIAGGGNTSYKDENRLWVKASGHALATITEDGFAVLDRTLLNEMGEKAYNEDTAIREEQVKNDLAVACVTKDRRPSVETSLHNCMGFAFVVHLHPTLVNGLMCSANAEAACGEIFPEALYIEYTDPGYTLFKKVYDRINAYKAANGKEPQVIFLQNHGIFVGGDTTAEIEGIYSEILGKLEAKVAALPEGGSEVSPTVTDVIPAIRQMLSRSGRGLKTLKVTKNALVDYFLDGSREKIAAPFTPDIIVYCKSAYIFIDAESDEEILKQAEEKIEAFAAEKGYTPKVLLIKGVGLVAVGDNFKNAQIITDVFTDAMKVAFYAQSFGGEHPMEKAWIDFIDNWEVENYRRKVAAGSSKGRVEGKTIIVTGAAQGFGEGIARELMAQGANIVVADLNEATGEKTAASFNEMAGSNKAIFVKTNVADMTSLQNLMRQTILNFGALDAFVSNAGVVRAGGLDVMTPENFEFVTKINYEAYFFCAKAASHIMKIETRYDPDYFADIIQVNSKSGLRGSKANFAYAGGKFGGIGLTQSFALELAPDRVKVNSICPGNYYDGPLWSNPENGLFIQYLNAGKVPGAKTVQDVKDYYLAQVPMRKGCNPVDVCKAILYAIDQTGETGQAIPVTGGQVMLA